MGGYSKPKKAAQIYSDMESLSEQKAELAQKSNLTVKIRQDFKDIERKMKKLGEIIKYTEQYQTNRIYHVHYQKSKDKDRYFRQHEAELLLHDGAVNILKQWKITPENMDIKKLQDSYRVLLPRKNPCSQNTKH